MSNKKSKYETQLDITPQTIRYFNSIPAKTLDMLTKHMKDIIFICDDSLNVLYASKSIERITGYEKEKYFGTGLKKIITEETANYIRRKVKSNPEENLFTYGFVHPNGNQMYFRCIVDLLTCEESGELFYVLTVEDVTSEKEVEELMLRSEKMSVTGQLAAGIAHEIRNPLTALKGFLQLLQSGVGDKDAYCKVMIDEIEKIDLITSELLTLSKPTTDSFENYVLYEIVTDIVTLFQLLATQKGIKIRNEIDKNIVVRCDQSQIKQVLINLIKNALEEMDVSGEIIITGTELAHFIQVDVIDQGIGIAQEDIEKITEPFFTTKEEGTGLGLVVTKQIIDHHNGILEVFRNEIIGTTFRMLLPKVN